MDEHKRPKWMDSEYDETHKEEIKPLFGTGKVSLQGEGNDDDDLESSRGVSYGAVAPSDDDDNDNNSDARQATVFSTTSSASAKSALVKKGTKNANTNNSKVREIVITETGKPEMPRPNCLVASFKFIETIGIIVCLALLASQVIPFVLVPLDELGLANSCLKVYISLFSLLFALLECDVPIRFLREASFLQNYFSRGFLYSFIGLSALEEAYSERVEDMIAHSKDEFRVSWISLFMQMSAWSLLVIGGLYMVFGLCCLNAIRTRVYRNHKEKWDTYREAMRLYRQQNP